MIATTDDLTGVTPIRDVYDGDESLEGPGVAFRFRGKDYFYQYFDLGYALYIGRPGVYPQEWVSRRGAPGNRWGEGFVAVHYEGDGDDCRRVERELTADEADLTPLAFDGTLRRLVSDTLRLGWSAWEEERREDPTPLHKPDY
jgi:hypothetical protein